MCMITVISGVCGLTSDHNSDLVLAGAQAVLDLADEGCVGLLIHLQHGQHVFFYLHCVWHLTGHTGGRGEEERVENISIGTWPRSPYFQLSPFHTYNLIQVSDYGGAGLLFLLGLNSTMECYTSFLHHQDKRPVAVELIIIIIILSVVYSGLWIE